MGLFEPIPAGSFVNVYEAALAGKPSYIYQFGDHDPTGCLIPKDIATRLNNFCKQYGCALPTVERIAVEALRASEESERSIIEMFARDAE